MNRLRRHCKSDLNQIAKESLTSLNTRVRKHGKDWAVFGEDLKLLADKEYSELQEEAREQFALNQFMSQLERMCSLQR
jgi:hypothetical protein